MANAYNQTFGSTQISSDPGVDFICLDEADIELLIHQNASAKIDDQ